MQKFLHRVRLQVTATLGLLSRQQSIFVDKMSQIVIHESTDFDKTSTDEELREDMQNRDLDQAFRQMLKSKEKVD